MAVLATVSVASGCDDTVGEEPSIDDYRAEMTAICEETSERLDALPSPPAEISLTDFATEAASALEAEAERSRVVDPPGEVDDDHRAFVANTDDQASNWRALAAVPTDDDEGLNATTERIAQLTLGRDDLATSMGLDACRRTDS